MKLNTNTLVKLEPLRPCRHKVYNMPTINKGLLLYGIGMELGVKLSITLSNRIGGQLK
jgi:hypothetical protein